MTAILELIATLLSTLAEARHVFGDHTAGILGATATLVRQGEAAVPVLETLTGHVQDMATTAATHGSPTDAQVTTLQEHVAAIVSGRTGP